MKIPEMPGLGGMAGSVICVSALLFRHNFFESLQNSLLIKWFVTAKISHDFKNMVVKIMNNWTHQRTLRSNFMNGHSGLRFIMELMIRLDYKYTSSQRWFAQKRWKWLPIQQLFSHFFLVYRISVLFECWSEIPWFDSRDGWHEFFPFLYMNATLALRSDFLESELGWFDP